MPAYIHTHTPIHRYIRTYVVLTLTHEYACIHTDVRNNKGNNTRIITIQFAQLTNQSEGTQQQQQQFIC